MADEAADTVITTQFNPITIVPAAVAFFVSVETKGNDFTEKMAFLCLFFVSY